MFSVNQKRYISAAIQKILRDTNHPELPESEIKFSIRVEGIDENSWAIIKNNDDVIKPSMNAHNKMSDKSSNWRKN